MIKFRTFLLAGVASAELLTTAAYAQSGPTNSQPPLTAQSDLGMHALAAAQGQSTNSTPPIPNSDSNYLDDTLEWNMPVYIHPTGSSGVDLSSTFCLPANTPVIGLDSKYTTGTPPSSETVAGLSYGIGLMGTIKDSFNISLVFGADHASSKTYQYQDKPWASFALGYSFTK